MCGIGGYIDFNGTGQSRTVLEGLANSLSHRGPDAQGIWQKGPCGLAHRRLSIIDLESSSQPMVSTDGQFAITFNGEIYNFNDLRQELKSRGHSFRTTGDTEALLNAIAQWWSEAPNHLDGMFAFAAWDTHGERLLIARDPLGIKPLFYAQPAPGVLVFGSEIKAVLQHPQVIKSLDLAGLRQAYRFRSVYGDGTLYEGIKQLAPGHTLEFSRQGTKITQYYHLTEQRVAGLQMATSTSSSELVQQGLGILRSAVTKRLIADVPVGCFLSGGLDSSLITALMVEARGRNEETCTYSVGFANDPNSELPFAQRVADAFGTTHTEVHLTEADYLASLTRLTQNRDAPLSEPADPALAQMSYVAKRDVKAVLTGEGADELFCGYPKYSLANAPSVLRAALRLVGSAKASRIAGFCGFDERKALTVARALSPRNELDRIVQWFSEIERSRLQQLLPGIGWGDSEWAATTKWQRLAFESFANEDTSMKMQAVDCLTWLPGNLLERGDRMTMAASLEARVPFLDKELVAFSFGLRRSMKLRGRTRKWIVRQWGRQLLPDEIVQRRKASFQVPLNSWFRGEMKDSLHAYLTSPNGLISHFGDAGQVQGLLDAHHSGAIDASRALWSLLTIEIWYQDVFQKNTRA